MVGRFSRLFQGRTDVIGAEDGGCIRLYHDVASASGARYPVTDTMEYIYQGHLTGSRPIGIYPVVEKPAGHQGSIQHKRFVVKFGAVDIDVEDLPLAKNIWLALQAMDIPAWVERSRSKGYHVWVFSTEWVPAVLMRSALQVACDVVDYSPKEIYPKQTELADGSPGNYIRLPYPGALLHALVPSRRVMLDMGRPGLPGIGLESWVSLAWDSRVSRDLLEKAAALAAPPKPKHRRPVLGPGAGTYRDLAPLVGKMGGLAHTIWRDGPLEGADRSGTLYKLVVHLKEDGLTADEALVLLDEADSRWGKFSDRADKDDRLWEIIERVYDE